MGRFAEAQDVYDTLGRLFVDLVADDEVAAGFQRADTVLRCEYSDPDAIITLALLASEDPRVDLGATDLEPEVTMTMSADTGHLFWLGGVNVTTALARGQMRATGPVAQILRIVPMTTKLFPRYREQLVEMGRTDLTEALTIASI